MFHRYERSKEIPELDTSRSHPNNNLAADEQPLPQLDFYMDVYHRSKYITAKMLMSWLIGL